jgi:hypothetical protein
MFTGRLFTIGRLPTALATGPAMAAAIGPVEAAIALEVADTAVVVATPRWWRSSGRRRPPPLSIPEAIAQSGRRP